jgi:hypothetical protein
MSPNRCVRCLRSLVSSMIVQHSAGDKCYKTRKTSREKIESIVHNRKPSLFSYLRVYKLLRNIWSIISENYMKFLSVMVEASNVNLARVLTCVPDSSPIFAIKTIISSPPHGRSNQNFHKLKIGSSVTNVAPRNGSGPAWFEVATSKALVNFALCIPRRTSPK